MPEPFRASATAPLSILLNPIAWLLWLLDFLIWLLSIYGPFMLLKQKCGRRSAAVVNGDVWRVRDAKDALVTTPYPECHTVHDLMLRSFHLYEKRPACGTRMFLGEQKKEGAMQSWRIFGETYWNTYEEFRGSVTNFGTGLLQLGVAPLPAGVDLQKVGGPHTIIIYEDTSRHWITAALGAFSQSIVVATSYATLGIAALVEAIVETEARVIICNIKDVKKIMEACTAESGLQLTSVVYTTNCSNERTVKVSMDSKVKAYSLEEVIEMGSKAERTIDTPPVADSLAVIMYTSGSTGKPKGVMIKHSNMTASVASVAHKFEQFGLKPGHEVYLAYLPAAHILELVAEIAMFTLGGAVGFACPKSLSSKGACRKRPDGSLNNRPGFPYPPGAIQEFRPTAMAAVPKIWDILKKGVEEVLGQASGASRWFFQMAYAARVAALSQGREAPLFRALVFRKLKVMMGGRLKVGISGGGPISADVQTFIRTAFCIPFVQGYALTETTCSGCVQMPGDLRCGLVGPPLDSVEIMLRSCLNAQNEPEVVDRKGRPYLKTDRTHHDGSLCMGRGEVLIRGPSLATGYFQQREKTAEAFDANGWFHTGDVALILPDGSLRIVDRVKNLVKLKGGEYVAIEAMEKEYGTSVYVNGINGGILCYGDGEMDRPIALVQVNMKELQKWAKENGKMPADSVELHRSAAAEAHVLASLQAAGKSGGLASNEILAGVALIPGTGPAEGQPTVDSPWTPENGGLTASNKLNRQKIQERWAAVFEPVRAKGIR